jgi:hypothetical protein
LGVTEEQYEPLEQVALALSVLARAESGDKGEIVIPKANGSVAARFSGLKLEASVIRGFTSEGRVYALARGEDGKLSVDQGQAQRGKLSVNPGQRK